MATSQIEMGPVRFFNSPLAPRIVVIVALLLFVVTTILTFANEKAMFASMMRIVPADQEVIGQRYAQLLLTRDSVAIERSLDPAVVNSDTPSEVSKIVALLPKEKPRAIDLVGYHFNVDESGTTVSWLYELTYAQSWVAIAMGAKKTPDGQILESVRVLKLARFRGYFPLGGERSTHGQKTYPFVPCGLSA